MKRTADSRKQQIIAEATRLFSKLGYDSVTTKELALACGVSEPALYRYFPSKEAIYDEVLNSLESRLEVRDLFARLAGETDVERLLSELAGQILEFFKANQDIYRLMLYSALCGHAKAKKVYRAVRGTYVDFLTEQFNRLRAANVIVTKNNEITARCFVGMVFECAMSATLFSGFLGKRYQPSEVVQNNISIFSRGLYREMCPTNLRG